MSVPKRSMDSEGGRAKRIRCLWALRAGSALALSALALYGVTGGSEHVSVVTKFGATVAVVSVALAFGLASAAISADRERLNPWRLRIMFPYYVLMVVASRQPWFDGEKALGADQGLMWLGLGLTACGLTLRLWSYGCLRKNVTLAQSGPYALTRNPLYLGTLWIGSGLALSTGTAGIAVALSYLCVFWVIYRSKIEVEEERLAYRFGASYQEYCARVPRFWPKSVPGLDWMRGFEWRNVIANHGLNLVASVLIIGMAQRLMAAVGWPVLEGRETLRSAWEQLWA